MNAKIFYLPFYYWFNFNLRGFKNLLGYIFTLHLPVITYTFASLNSSQYLYFYSLYFLNFFIFITFYEFFYIQNDYLAYKEKDSTIRFNFQGVSIPWVKIILLRVTFVVLAYLFLYLLNISFFNHLVVLISIGLVFFVHNILKTTYRFSTFFLLYFLKEIIFFELPSGYIPINTSIYYILILGFFGTIPYFYKKNLNKKFPFDIIYYYLFVFLLLGIFIFFAFGRSFFLIFILFLITIKSFKRLGN